MERERKPTIEPLVNLGAARPYLPGIKEILRLPSGDIGRDMIEKIVGGKEARWMHRALVAKHPQAFEFLNTLASEKGFKGVILHDEEVTLGVEKVHLYHKAMQGAGFSVPQNVLGEYVSPDSGKNLYLNYVRVNPRVLPAMDFMMHVDRAFTLRGMKYAFAHESEHVHGSEHMVTAKGDSQWKADREAVLKEVGEISAPNMERITDFFAIRDAISFLLVLGVEGQKRMAQDLKSAKRLKVRHLYAKERRHYGKFLPAEASDVIHRKSHEYLTTYLSKVSDQAK